MSNNAPDYKDNLVFEPKESKMQEYKHEYIHYEFDIRGEKFHLMDDEEYNGALLKSFYDGVSHGEKELKNSEKMRDYTAEYVAKLEEKLKIAEEALSYALGFYGYCKMKNYPCVGTKDFEDDKAKIEQALAKIKE